MTVQQATYTTPMSNKLNLMLGRHMVPFWSPSYIPSHSDSVSILLIVNLLFLLLSHDSSSHPFSLSSLFFDMNWLWYKICSRKLTIGTLHYNHTALTNAIVVSQFVHIISIWYPNIDWVLNTGNIGHWNWNLMVEKKNNNIQQSEILHQSVKIWYCSYTYDIVLHRKSKWSGLAVLLQQRYIQHPWVEYIAYNL